MDLTEEVRPYLHAVHIWNLYIAITGRFPVCCMADSGLRLSSHLAARRDDAHARVLQEFFEDLEHATKPRMHRKPLQQGGPGGAPVAALRPLLDKARRKLIAVRPCA